MTFKSNILPSSFNCGFSLVSTMVSLSIFFTVWVSFSYWATNQNLRINLIYSQRQMLRIAESQWQRQFLGLPCESIIHQNNKKFLINCNSNKIEIRDPQFRDKINSLILAND